MAAQQCGGAHAAMPSRHVSRHSPIMWLTTCYVHGALTTCRHAYDRKRLTATFQGATCWRVMSTTLIPKHVHTMPLTTEALTMHRQQAHGRATLCRAHVAIYSIQKACPACT